MDDWQVQAREAGWLPPADVRFKAWCAANLNRGESCRWCGALRRKVHGGLHRAWWREHDEPQPHRPGCRFFGGAVTHKEVNGHQGTFDWWVICSCGKHYAQHDEEGNKRAECPDAALTEREPQEEDLTAV